MGFDATLNEERKRREHLQAQRDAAAIPGIVDRFGRPVVVGGLYTMYANELPCYEVLEVKPILDPRVEVGLFEVTLISRITFGMRRGVPARELQFVGRKPTPEEAATQPAASQPPDEPPADMNPLTVPPEGQEQTDGERT